MHSTDIDNVLIVYEKFATAKSGGARESLLTLLNGLARNRDISVTVYQTPPIDAWPTTEYEYEVNSIQIRSVPKFTWMNQVYARHQWRRELRSVVDDTYDLILTQNRVAPAAISVANQAGIPSLFFVRSMALTGYEKYNPEKGTIANLRQTDLGGRVQYPFLRRNFRQYREAAQLSSHTIANSEFTRSRLAELFDIDARVIYPPIQLEQYRVEYNTSGSIVMVNPRAEYKGPDIFLKIAKEMSEESFILAGPLPSQEMEEQTEQMDNVSYIEWCEDIRTVYRDAKVVVVPSRWEEPFGRVPAEAMVSGIPCVVSDRGGLPEVVGETGEIVRDIELTEAWTAAIERALDNHDPDAQRDRVSRFSAETQIHCLEELLDEL
ncbi:glycosyltransferase family 4 protein [Haloarcula laminariae]|uniref:glycosyltransferase family 4 protein n=1 Tax=Haloarcula laminariae TaxID=2961577 RepID=UPI0021CA6797|nr:glycosyltransferase family 4 protein [Halomicroarcula laminariae]